MADAYGPDDWRGMLAEVSYPEPGAHRLFEPGDVPQLASDRPARPGKAPGAPLFYRFNRLVHDHVFDPESKGFAVARAVYGRLESMHMVKPAHVLEQAAKIPMYGCKDCGDCSLPDIAYQCPEGACAKNQRNGPCGGSLNGRVRGAGQALHLGQRLRPSQALRGSAHHARSRACPAGQCAARHQRLGQHLHGP